MILPFEIDLDRTDEELVADLVASGECDRREAENTVYLLRNGPLFPLD